MYLALPCARPCRGEQNAWEPQQGVQASFPGAFGLEAALVCQLQTHCWDSHLIIGYLVPFLLTGYLLPLPAVEKLRRPQAWEELRLLTTEHLWGPGTALGTCGLWWPRPERASCPFRRSYSCRSVGLLLDSAILSVNPTHTFGGESSFSVFCMWGN